MEKQKHYLSDKRLSFKAKGIIQAGLKQDLSFKDLLEFSKDGRDKLRAGINELIKYGYCIYLEQRNEKGEICGGLYHFDKMTSK
jgi:hypothetical protein